jgi:hypothetical protein
LVIAFEALAERVRDEYPEGYPLAYIVRQWGCADKDTVEAVEAVEAYLDQKS